MPPATLDTATLQHLLDWCFRRFREDEAGIKAREMFHFYCNRLDDYEREHVLSDGWDKLLDYMTTTINIAGRVNGGR